MTKRFLRPNTSRILLPRHPGVLNGREDEFEEGLRMLASPNFCLNSSVRSD